MENNLIEIILFLSIFLIVTGLIQRLTKQFSFLPYTDALLIIGAVAQIIFHTLHIESHFEISSDIIYYVLLPLLLFESAFHINYHQFRLQFKTITFLATFGLLLSVFTIGYILAVVLGYPLDAAILFGAIISATDPIAVISLFKTLGAPKRLGLVADGESMLNDATGVIAFRVISAFVLMQTRFSSTDLLQGMGNFLYVFVGSIIFGAIIGYIFSKIIETIENDRILETTMTVAAALGSFVAAEHFFAISGVISTVIAGIVVGNLGKTKFSPGVRSFVEEFWAYFAFLSVSIVFFFATFNLDFSIFTHNPLNSVVAVLAVLIGRAVSVYVSFFITNRSTFFKNEPNVPLSWQHVLNWGGLRGVIPLVLVYSLPKTYIYRNDMLSFTFSAFMFTLLINGLTIRNLLFALGLHLPKKEEEIMQLEMNVIELEETKQNIKQMKIKEFDPSIVNAIKQEIQTEEQAIKLRLKEIATPTDFKQSLHLQSILLERKALQALFNQGIISENAFFDFETEIDLQQDALEYPEVFKGRGFKEGGKINTSRLFYRNISFFRRLAHKMPMLKYIIRSSTDTTIKDRISLLKVRILTSEMAIKYFNELQHALGDYNEYRSMIQSLIKEQETLIARNKEELKKLSADYRSVLEEYERNFTYSHISPKSSSE